LHPGDLVVFAGDLGAGKTFLVRAIARALGVSDPVTSPTFTLVKEYTSTKGVVVHADLYRLLADEVARAPRTTPPGTGSTARLLAEVARLGIRERRREEAILLVEWGHEAVDALGGAPELRIMLSVNKDGGRVAVLSGPRAGDIVGEGCPP
jgi:tRNA threonylcarbamoyladenosine biosynthesis protein TsaE